MIFENDTLRDSGLNDKNNMIENESLFPPIINSYGVTAFLINSLEKIKNNATCDILKGTINACIEEYILHIREFHSKNTSFTDERETEVRFESPSFTLYAKTAYYKVLKEEEYISRFLDILENNKTD
ncbi:MULTISPECIES: hypothetical protein [Chryseobacterium]|jgi:hypothetical protein|nr:MULTISPECIES: hypothetical protein [Chryseobacterium]PXW18069.1 hypothetical protein C8D70_101395 [Chryseobacterium sp. CBTAP 102]PXW18074.1 hypothetical protein C8D70_101400 [Chryseobacterium sp. CBTAP 102]SIQ05695.1 hypothetical protein SAMN05880573_102133 [Chryseobacterium sp. RU33C]